MDDKELLRQFQQCAEGADCWDVEAAAVNIFMNCIDHYQTPQEKAATIAYMIGFVVSAAARDQNPETIDKIASNIASTVAFVVENLLCGTAENLLSERERLALRADEKGDKLHLH